MINYQHFTLDNGLRVYVHQDLSTPMAALNIVYNVGSRDESEQKTGFAHLFEHLMFGGSKNIPSYDTPLQQVGAENNAFTSPDLTNYYITLPAVNLETAFWLESDRMMALSFDPKVLEIQRKVVIEEFKQRYLNQPYGDVWLKLRPLTYTAHPYKWATIGKEIAHIEDATMQDVEAFFYQFYLPNNAVMVVAGNVQLEQVKQLAKKWFEPIPAGKNYTRNLPKEPLQTQARHLDISGNVPLNGIYKAWHTPGRHQEGFYESDLFSDILGRGKAARLHQKLVKEQGLFNAINAYTTSSLDPGLLIISGHLNKDIALEQGNKAIEEVLEEILAEGVAETELEKVKNQAESTLVFGEVELLNRAMSLAFAANAGQIEGINQESERIQAVSTTGINKIAKQMISPSACSTMFYHAKS